MIQDLDMTLKKMIENAAVTGSELAAAEISFELPDSTWRTNLSVLTLNVYLYSVAENTELRKPEPMIVRNTDGSRVKRIRPPIRIDCGYCITAWSTATTDAVLEEHRLLGQALEVLMRNRTIPSGALQGSLSTQLPPYPTVIASAVGPKTDPDFWGALDQQLKPSLNYVVTLGLLLDDPESELGFPVTDVEVDAHHMTELPSGS